jgi:hypothetical protein
MAMLLDLLRFNPNAYLKRATVLLQEAQMARIEHQAAAEHHAALARMYEDRVRRLERELTRSTRLETVEAADLLTERPALRSVEAAGRH